MANIYWKNAVSGAFSDADDWLEGVAPGPSDSAELAASGKYTVTATGDVAVESLATTAGATLEVSGGTFALAQGSGSGADQGTIQVDDGASLEMSGKFVNSGLVSLAADATLLVDDSLVLTSSGAISLGDPTTTILGGPDNGGALTNEGETIKGAGEIGAGDGSLRFTNMIGVVNADIAGETLTLTTGNTLTNSATLKASNGGTLTILDQVDNTGGTISAIGGVGTTTVNVEGQVNGGVVAASGTGAVVNVEAAVSHATLFATGLGAAVDGDETLADDVIGATLGGTVSIDDASLVGDTLTTDATGATTLGSVTLYGGLSATTIGAGARIFIENNAYATVVGPLVDRGVLSLAAPGTGYTRLDIDRGVTLSGHGAIVLGGDNEGNSEIVGDGTDHGALTNLGATIEGAGQIGGDDARLKLYNTLGAIDANVADDDLLVYTGQSVTNNATFEATGGGVLTVNDKIGNSGGNISAIGAGSAVYLEGAVSGGSIGASGGTLKLNAAASNASVQASNGGFVDVTGPTLTGAPISAAGVGSNVELDNGVVVSGAPLTTSGGGEISIGYATLDSAASAVSLGAGSRVVVDNGGNLYLEGVFSDQAEIDIGQTGSPNYSGITIEGAVSLNGAGRIVLAPGSGGEAWIWGQDDGVLTNNGQTIVGAGGIGNGNGQLTLDNMAGLIDANFADDTLTISTGNVVTNKTTLEATGGGILSIQDVVTNTAATIGAFTGSTVNINDDVMGGLVEAIGADAVLDINADVDDATVKAGAGGAIDVSRATLDDDTTVAAGAGSSVSLGYQSFVVGGSLTAAGGATISDTSNATLDGTASAVTIGAGTHLALINGANLDLSGAIVLDGEIDVGGADSVNYTVINVSGATTLTGGGVIELTAAASGQALIAGDSSDFGTLTNQGDKILGAGGIGYGGDGQLTFDNLGLVDANVLGYALSLDTGNTVTNGKTLESTQGGTLILNDNVTNSAGAIYATGGGAVNIYGAVTGGLVEALGAGASLNDEGSVVNATVQAWSGGTILVQQGSLDNDATLVSGLASALDLNFQSIVAGGSLTAKAGGTITANGAKFDGTASTVTIAAGTSVFIADGASLDMSGAIVDKGAIVVGDSTSQNYTELYVSGATTLSGGGLINLVATPNGESWIFGDGGDLGTLTNEGDTIEGAGGIGSGDGHLTLDNASGLIVANVSGANLGVNTGSPLTNTAKMEATGRGSLSLNDSIANTGGLIAAFSGGAVNANGAVTGGLLEATGGGSALNLEADVTGATVEGLGGGAIVVSQATLDDDTTSVSGVGSSLNLGYNSDVVGGTLTATAGATIFNSANALLDGSTSAVTIAAKTTVLDADAQDMQLAGSIIDKGAINIGDATSYNWTFLDVDGATTLTGGGQINLVAAANAEAWLVGGSTGGNVLTNQGDSVLGAGGIGYFGNGQLTFDNASGLVEATVPGGTITVDTGNLVTNAATFEAAAGAQLTIYDNVVNAAGLIVAADDSVSGIGVVEFSNQTTTGGRLVARGGEIEVQNATLSGVAVSATSGGVVELDGADVVGGSLTVSGAGTYEVTGQSTFDGTGAGAPVVVGPGVDIGVDSTTLELKGAIHNAGAIVAMANATSTFDIDGAVTLSGLGALTLTSSDGGVVSGYGYIEGDSTDGGVLDISGQTISGDGRFGGNGASLQLNNFVSGVIDATGPVGLLIETGATISNSGLIEATNPFALGATGGLQVDDAIANSGTIYADGGNVTLEGAVSGAGKVEIAAGGIATLDAASSNSVSFTGAGELATNDSAGFTGRVSGFAADDAIDFGDLAAAYTSITKIATTGAAGTVTNVTLTDSQTSQSVTLHLLNLFAGQFGGQASDYHLAVDSQGSQGTLFTLAAAI